jgi:hypothetical protein
LTRRLRQDWDDCCKSPGSAGTGIASRKAIVAALQQEREHARQNIHPLQYLSRFTRSWKEYVRTKTLL